MTEEQDNLITDWFRRVRENQFIHYACGNHFSRLNYWLGVPTIALTTMVGTAVFTSLDNQAIGNYKIIIGIISILASVLAALQTFLGYSQRAEKHRLTASGYAAIRRELELLKTSPIQDTGELTNKLESIKIHLDHLAESAQEVPGKIWQKHINELKGKEHKRIFHLPVKQNM